jgi:hypothetical protein
MREKSLPHPSEWRNIPKCVSMTSAALLMRMDQVEANSKNFQDGVNLKTQKM